MPDAAERLRTAAARMRALAEAATPGPWRSDVRDDPKRLMGIDGPNYAEVLLPGGVSCMAYCYGGTASIEGDNLDNDAAYIAAMHPAVALAVADLLADTADDLDRATESDQRLQQMAADLGHKPLGDGPPFAHHLAALKVADAFLGATP